ncbi:hypothetical protein QQ045_005077 [Rhodiola kirilowii]
MIHKEHQLRKKRRIKATTRERKSQKDLDWIRTNGIFLSVASCRTVMLVGFVKLVLTVAVSRGGGGDFRVELEKEVTGEATSDREELNKFRSGSAPPTVEGSLNAVGGLYGGVLGNVEFALKGTDGAGGRGFGSEEELRSQILLMPIITIRMPKYIRRQYRQLPHICICSGGNATKKTMSDLQLSRAPSPCIPQAGGDCHFFGVFDGHGCSHVATRCKARMHDIVKSELEKANMDEQSWKDALGRSFSLMDAEAQKSSGVASNSCRCELQMPQCDAVGSTAVVAIVSPEKIVVSNCGDSRAVLCRNGVAIPLSSDHKVTFRFGHPNLVPKYMKTTSFLVFCSSLE